MKLPPLPEPSRYVGLYAFDFGDRVSVGYTAEEVDILLSSDAHAAGQAYRIHRVDDQGRVELEGVTARQLAGDDILLFACRDKNRAADEFSALRKLAGRRPLPCGVRIELADVPDLDPPHVVSLMFPRHASEQISRWLLAAKFGGGDLVMGGQEILAMYRAAGPSAIASLQLRGDPAHLPRSREEVLAGIDRPLQR